MAQEVADLYISLRSNASGLVPGFTEAGASGERMAAQISAGAQAILRDTTGIVRDARTVAEQWGTTAEQTVLSMREIQAQTDLLATDMTLAAGRAEAATEAMAVKIDAAAASTTATTAGTVAALQRVGVVIGAVAIGLAAVTAKMAGDFETSTNKLVTSAGETQQGLDAVRQGILGMAADVGVSSEQLSDAIYKIESAGYHGAAGLGVLKSAEQGAKAEGADGVEVADALSSALRDYYPQAQSAADVTRASADTMSKFIAATSAGKLTFNDLAASLNSILPVASAANVSLSDTLGVLASMTVHGISAQQAAQNMADALRHLQSPTAAMSKSMATLGIDSTEVAQKLGERGLAGTMQYLSERVKAAMPPGTNQVILDLGNALAKSTPQVQALGRQLLDGSLSLAEFSKSAKALDPISAQQALAFATLAGSMHQLGTQQLSGAQVMQSYSGMMQKVMGDATGLKVSLMTTGENAGYTSDAIKTISGSTADAQGNVRGWSEVQGTFNQRLAEARAGLGAFGIAIGTVLLPVFSKILGAVADVTGWLAKHRDAAVAVAVVVGGVLTVALFAAAAAAWAFITPLLPIIGIAALVVAAIAAVAFGAYMLITHWSDVVGFFGRVWDAIKSAFVSATSWVVDLLSGWVSWLTGLPGRILSGLASLGSILANLARDAWRNFLRASSIAIDSTVTFIKNLPHEAGYALGSLAGTIARVAVNAWNGFTNSLKQGWTNTVQWFHDLPKNVTALLADAHLWLQGPGKDLIRGILSGIATKWEEVNAWFASIPGRLQAWWINANVWLYVEALTLIAGVERGITDAWRSVSDWFSNLGPNLLRFFANAGTWLRDSGWNLITGLWNGISSAGSWLWNKITDFASGIIQGFKDAFGVKSPSTVFASIGGYLVDGLTNGITDHSHKAVSAATDMASRVVNAMSGMQAVATLAVQGGEVPALSSTGMTAGSGNPGAVLSSVGSGTNVQVINVTIPVQGSVIAEQDLQQRLQVAVTRYAGRNNGAGWTPAFSR